MNHLTYEGEPATLGVRGVTMYVISQICDADRRTNDPFWKKVASNIYIQNNKEEN